MRLAPQTDNQTIGITHFRVSAEEKAVMKNTALYRFYDKDETLLYVGISKDWLFRLDTHRKDKTWIQEVSNVEIEWYSKRINAELAERSAIRWESPKYNKQSVVLKNKTWQHFEYIRLPEGLDQFHIDLYQETNKFISEAFPMDCQYGNIVEWALLESLARASSSIDEIIVPCADCMKIADSWWLLEGHSIVCSAFIGRNK